MKKFATMLLALLLMTATALGESSVSPEVAALVPETAVLLEVEQDDGLMEYEFRDEDMFYEVIVRDGKAIALITRNAAVKPSKENLLSEEEAVSGLAGEKLFAYAEKDDGRWVWKVILREENDLVEYELNAETGEMMETERYFDADVEQIPEQTKKPDPELEEGRLRWDRD